MGRGQVTITTELLVEMLKGVSADTQSCVRVIGNPIPVDAKAIPCRIQRVAYGVIHIEFESGQIEGKAIKHFMPALEPICTEGEGK